jgi:DNA repair protein RecN (Recombination protein N)
LIESLKIKNVALLRDVKIDFANGFNVLLGETGAGKSIVLDALNFVLGAKADKELITHGESEMRVEAVFSSYSSFVSQALEEFGLEDEGILIINRFFSLQGKSEVRVNGNACTLTMLKEITKFLVDSYSQHENLILLKPKNHLHILDSYNPELLEPEKQEISLLLKTLKEVNKKINDLGGDGAQRERLLDLLSYQIEEISTLSPTEKEELELTQKIELMRNSEKIALSLAEGLQLLDGSDYSALNMLRTAIKNLDGLERFSENFASINQRLNSTLYELEDIISTYSDEESKIYFNEKEYEILDLKLDKYKLIKKKYGQTVNDVINFLNNATEQFDNLKNAEKHLKELEINKAKLNQQLETQCKKLSDKRKTLAAELETKLKSELEFLGMKNTKFIINFQKSENYNLNGNDEVEFLFSANAGVDVKPLSKIISGGEMSRFSLALKNIIKDEQACLVFDEIDAGISGEIGKAVAERIANLSVKNQIICISHSAQVCAMADNFFFVEKNVKNNLTTTNITKLKEQEIINQLAVMSSGKQLNQVSLAYANQLLTLSQQFKSKLV